VFTWNDWVDSNERPRKNKGCGTKLTGGKCGTSIARVENAGLENVALNSLL